MTNVANVLEKKGLKQMIDDFTICEVNENSDGTLTVTGDSEELYAIIHREDVIALHPGADAYTATRDCDRGNHYRIASSDLWNDGSDQGHPAAMVAEVWDRIKKEWRNENDEKIFPEVLKAESLGFQIDHIDVNGYIAKAKNPIEINSWSGLGKILTVSFLDDMLTVMFLCKES